MMHNKKTNYFLLGAICLFVVLAFGILSHDIYAADWKPEVKFIKIACGSSGGMWLPQGTIAGEHIKKMIPGLNVSTMPGGGVDNIKFVGNEEINLAMGYGNMVYLGLKGLPPFTKPYPNLKWIASIVPYTLSIIVKADSDIKSIRDLVGKKIAPGQKGFMSESWFKSILEEYDITYDKILNAGGSVNFVSYADSAQLMQDGHVDCMVLYGSHPSGQAMQLSSQFKIRFLSVEDEIITKIIARRPGTIKTKVPGVGVYGLGENEQASTIGAVYGFFTNETLSEEMVYRITGAIYNAVPEMAKATHEIIADLMTPENQRLGVPDFVPFHPGAERWHKEHTK